MTHAVKTDGFQAAKVGSCSRGLAKASNRNPTNKEGTQQATTLEGPLSTEIPLQQNAHPFLFGGGNPTNNFGGGLLHPDPFLSRPPSRRRCLCPASKGTRPLQAARSKFEMLDFTWHPQWGTSAKFHPEGAKGHAPPHWDGVSSALETCCTGALPKIHTQTQVWNPKHVFTVRSADKVEVSLLAKQSKGARRKE